MIEYAAVAGAAAIAILLARRWSMGFLSRLFGAALPAPETKKKMRGPSRSPAERLKIQEARFLENLKTEDPAAYRAMMEKRLGINLEPKDELAQMQETVKKLRALGLMKNANEVDSGASWIKDAVAGLPYLIPLITGQQQPSQAPPAAHPQLPQPAQPHAEPVYQPAPVQQPAHPYSPQPPYHVAPTPPAAAHQQQEAALMMTDPTAIFLRSQLDGRTPEEVARWLLAQEHELARTIVERMLAVPESQAYGVLVSGAESQPAFRGVAAWLRSRGELWVTSVARELRRIAESAPSAGAPMGF